MQLPVYCPTRAGLWYPLELHIVHTLPAGSLRKCVGTCYSVTGIMFKLDPLGADNPVLDQILSAAGKAAKSSAIIKEGVSDTICCDMLVTCMHLVPLSDMSAAECPAACGCVVRLSVVCSHLPSGSVCVCVLLTCHTAVACCCPADQVHPAQGHHH